MVCPIEFIVLSEHPKKDKRLPIVLSKENVRKLIENTNNKKHRWKLFRWKKAGKWIVEHNVITEVRSFKYDHSLDTYSGKL